MFGKRNAKVARVIFDDAAAKQNVVFARAAKPAVINESAEDETAETTAQHSSLAAMGKLQGLLNPKTPPMFVWSAVMCIKRMVRNRAKRKKVRNDSRIGVPEQH